ncbi:Hsp20/alpha crystallin family protein [Phototrophicus methaneseepsis]|uniref:Hsp20/alpha crystallin family protein n=1 Tax=Phototrophicus methaneseepsis TaxID=2710758 RepID=A0A7S8E6A5_9CHLR|nr:Hsp20/alpha crystallin family protein [Phototrophicus methaneseepsis]QPC81167.1 Hsp20/alpha crystallin family protein [Phototrophicus methaneseepsis]
MSEQKFDPMRELARIGNTMGKVIEQGINQGISQVQAITNTNPFKIDVYEYQDTVVVRTAPIDGEVVEGSLNVSMEGNVLTISGETTPEEVPANASYLLQERRFGIFARSVTIDIPVLSNEAKAKLKNRILTITLPVDTERYKNIEVSPDE